MTTVRPIITPANLDAMRAWHGVVLIIAAIAFDAILPRELQLAAGTSTAPLAGAAAPIMSPNALLSLGLIMALFGGGRWRQGLYFVVAIGQLLLPAYSYVNNAGRISMMLRGEPVSWMVWADTAASMALTLTAIAVCALIVWFRAINAPAAAHASATRSDTPSPRP